MKKNNLEILYKRDGVEQYVLKSNQYLDNTSYKLLINSLSSLPEVNSVQPDLYLHDFGLIKTSIDDGTISTAPVNPNDTKYANQWYLSKIEAPKAWTLSKGNPAIIVAVIEKGIDWDMSELSGNIYVNPLDGDWKDKNIPTSGDKNDNDFNKYIDDYKGYDFGAESSIYGSGNVNNDSRITTEGLNHGNQVASIISARANNEVGIAGIAGGWGIEKGCRLMCLKDGGSKYSGSESALSALIMAIDYAVLMKARVINISQGLLFETNNIQLNKALLDAAQNNVIVVCSSGNSANNPAYPASNPNVIAVVSSDETDMLTPTAYTRDYENKFIAPGDNILTLEEGNTTSTRTGDSYAAPIVSGVIALMLSVNPCLRRDMVLKILRETSDKVHPDIYSYNSEGKSISAGYGRVNAAKAVFAASNVHQEAADLFSADSFNDFGAEPNGATKFSWVSPNIYVRNQIDNKRDNQSPISGQTNYVYVTVFNKGCTPSSGTEELKLYWAKASSSVTWPTPWNGQEVINGVKMGGPVGILKIPALGSRTATTLKFDWIPPSPVDYKETKDMDHFCLLSRIETKPDGDFGMTYPEGKNLYRNILYNNNIVSKNVIIINGKKEISGSTSGGTTCITIKTTDETVPTQSFNFISSTNKNTPLIASAFPEIKLDPNLISSWIKNGMQGNGVQVQGLDKIKILSNDAWLEGVKLDPNQAYSLCVDFGPVSSLLGSTPNYVFNIVQYQKNDIIGGEQFVYHVEDCSGHGPPISGKAADIIEFKNNDLFQLYPNPANDKIALRSDKKSLYIIIMDFSGKKVKELYLNEEAELDIRNLSSGPYAIVALNEQNEIIAKRVLIKQ